MSDAAVVSDQGSRGARCAGASRQLSVPKILRCEFTIAPPHADGALAGSGLIIVNPPFPLERELRVILPVLTRLLAPMGAYRLDWLAGE